MWSTVSVNRAAQHTFQTAVLRFSTLGSPSPGYGIFPHADSLSLYDLVIINDDSLSLYDPVIINDGSLSLYDPVIINDDNLSLYDLVIINYDNLSLYVLVIINMSACRLNLETFGRKCISRQTHQSYATGYFTGSRNAAVASSAAGTGTVVGGCMSSTHVVPF